MASRIACVAGGIRERVSGGGTVIFSGGRSSPFAKPAREFASGEANSTPRQFTHGFATRAHGFATKTKALTTKTKALARQIGCARVYKKVDEKAGAWDRNYLGRMKKISYLHTSRESWRSDLLGRSVAWQPTYWRNTMAFIILPALNLILKLLDALKEHLWLLIESQNLPRIFIEIKENFVRWSSFFSAFLAQIIFSSSQTYELMHCLEEIRLSFRTKEYLEHPDREPAEEPLLRTLSQGPGLKSAKRTKVIISLFSWSCL